MKSICRFLILALLLFTTACSDDTDSGSHVFKEKTETIDKAKEAEAIMLKTAADQAQAIDEQMQ